MKKFITLFVILFSAIALTSCFGELESLEWEDLPKSVYYVEEMTEPDFKASVSIKINGGNPLTLAAALSSNPTDLTFTGFDLDTPGSKMITIKYKSVSIYWAYQVIEGDIPSDEVTPTYGWYGNGSASTFILNNVNDLYGFANIVNGKDEKTADSFAGKTVKLGANIDLTGKVWTPIGAAPRKTNVEIEYIGHNQTTPTDPYKLYFKADNNLYVTYLKNGTLKEEEAKNLIPVVEKTKAGLLSYLDANLASGSNGYCFIGSYVFAQEDPEGDFYGEDTGTYQLYYSSDIILGNAFEGTFDGQGHKIDGLSDVGYTPTVVLTYANVGQMVTGYTFGLFGVVNGSVTVKNITFENITITGAYYQVGEGGGVKLAEIDSVGAAIGYATGLGDLTIDNVKVLSGSITGLNAVAGVIGRGYNTGNLLIQNCENRATVNALSSHAGGIGGYFAMQTDFSVRFVNNINYGNISSANGGTGKSGGAGGIIHRSGSSTATNKAIFENCRNFGNINGIHHIAGNGIWSGYNPDRHELINCQNYGDIPL